MRLLLDAHLSPKRIGAPLRAAGQDVLALAEHPELEALTDAQVLEFAVGERRIVVTRNAKDFVPILRTWAEAGRHHHGCLLIRGIRTDRFGDIVRGVRATLDARPRAADWTDLVVAM